MVELDRSPNAIANTHLPEKRDDAVEAPVAVAKEQEGPAEEAEGAKGGMSTESASALLKKGKVN